jgi:hypothetical protein
MLQWALDAQIYLSVYFTQDVNFSSKDTGPPCYRSLWPAKGAMVYAQHESPRYAAEIPPGGDCCMTPEQRRIRAQIAANTMWSKPFAREDQAHLARAALFARLERQVDPDGCLTPDHRTELMRSALRLHIAKLNAARARKRVTGGHRSNASKAQRREEQG